MPVSFQTSERHGVSPDKRTPRLLSIGRDGDHMYLSIYKPNSPTSGWDIYIDPEEVFALLQEHGYLRRLDEAYVRG